MAKKKKKTSPLRLQARTAATRRRPRKSPRATLPPGKPPLSPTDRDIEQFQMLLQLTAADSAQGVSITNNNNLPVSVSYSADNKKTWKPVATNPAVNANSTRVFDLRTSLGSAAQGPIYIRYKINAQTKGIGTGWYYSYADPPVTKACYSLSTVNGDTGPTYAPW